MKQDWTKDGTGAWFRLSKQRVVEGSGTPRALAVKLLTKLLPLLGGILDPQMGFFSPFLLSALSINLAKLSSLA